jgi:hypothetical protein
LRRGNNARGRSAVTATGRASVAHHIAINKRTPNTNHAEMLFTTITSLVVSNEFPSNSAKLDGIKPFKPEKITRANANRPIKNPLFLYAGIAYINLFLKKRELKLPFLKP